MNIASCEVSDTLTLLPGESRIIFTHEPAVDLVLLVDESGSMYAEHQWLRRMVKQLDKMLKKYGVGVTRPNLFAVIGYGSQYLDSEMGRVVSTGSQFVSSKEIDSLIDKLWVDGRNEDGYAAIKFGFDQLQFRDGTAKQFILITDEDRHEVISSLTYNSTRDALSSSNTQLNVIVSEEFAGSKSVPAMGLDSAMNAYIYYPLADYYSEMPANLSVRVVGGGRSVEWSGYGTTHEDYTALAHELGGAAWDIGLLSMGPPVADAFTSAFVSVEVQEILNQVGLCQNCSCGNAGGQCTVLDPFIGVYPECSKLLHLNCDSVLLCAYFLLLQAFQCLQTAFFPWNQHWTLQLNPEDIGLIIVATRTRILSAVSMGMTLHTNGHLVAMNWSPTWMSVLAMMEAPC